MNWRSGVLLLLLLGAFLLRMHGLNASSFWLDEILQVRVSRGPISEIWSSSPADKPPLDYYLQAISLRIGWESEWWARLPACLAGSLTVVVLAWLGRRIGGIRCAWMAAAVAGASPVMLAYSQEGRPYALMLLSECLFLLVALRFLSGEDDPWRRSITGWFLLAGSIILAIWSMYLNAIPVLIVLLFLMIPPFSLAAGRRASAEWLSRRESWFILATIGLLLCMAVLPLVLRGHAAIQQDRGRVELKFQVTEYLDIFAWGYAWYDVWRGSRWILLIPAAIGFLSMVMTPGRRLSGLLLLLLPTAGIPILGLVYAILGQRLDLRYVLIALPPILLLAASGLEAVCLTLHRMSGKRNSPDFMAAIVAILWAGIFSASILGHPPRKADWRGAVQYAIERTPPPGAILTGDWLDKIAVRYYATRFGSTIPLMDIDWDIQRIPALVEEHPGLVLIHRQDCPRAFRESVATEYPEPLSLRLVSLRMPARSTPEDSPSTRE